VKTTPDNNNLLDLVKKARKGTLVLPQFQRNFVWNRDNITGLLISILEGHFIGTFLLLRTDVDCVPFAMRPIQGVDLSESQLKPDWMILDGQQRLTSLHYVFSAPDIPLRWTKYPYRFFLDLRKVVEGELEDAVTSERADYVQDMLGREEQFETLVVPFTEIEHWNDWLNSYEQWLVARDQVAYFKQYFPRCKPAWNEVLSRIRNFEVPTIEIPKVPSEDPVRIAELCAIFEKMNSTGVRLSVYDLLTARMYRYRDDDGKAIDVHALWEATVAQYELLAHFSGGEPDAYGVFLLRTIALLRGLEVRSKSLVNLKPERFAEDWSVAARAMERALKRLTSTNDDGFGAFGRKWFPYSTMLSPLAALLHVIDRDGLGHKAYDLLKRWYWASVFTERYAGAVESTILRDYQDMVTAFRSGAARPQALSEAQTLILDNPNYGLRDRSRLNSTYRGIMCLIAIRGAKDFAANDAIEFHDLDDHHIFPRAYLRKLPPLTRPSQTEINSIVNRTLIAGTTNRRISRDSPSKYLQRIVPRRMDAKIMSTHYIDTGALAAMRCDDFQGFMDAREKILLAEVRRRVSGGMPV